MMKQQSIFDCLYPPAEITKPIRLIELFAGVGSQAMALRDLGANFEHYRVVEIDLFAIKSYNAIHGTSFEPTDITQIHGDDLGIVDKERYEYIMTYSFPCQDLSKAGKKAGMSKDGGTRSGLLWEVERILKELNEADSLPQVLLMENVPDVIGTKNTKDFNEWYTFLESIGYQSYYKLLNAKNYGVPQNRNRCFMVSILGNYSYIFPDPAPLEKCLSDVLESEVDERYYINDEIAYKFANKGDISKTIRTSDRGSLDRHTWDLIVQPMIIPENTVKGYAEAYPGDGVYINRPHQKRGVVQHGMIQTLTTSCNDVGVVIGSTQKNAYKGSLDGCCPTLTQAMGVGGGQIPMIAYPMCLNSKVDGKQPSIQNRIYDVNAVSTAITASFMPKIYNQRIRRLTPLECWRLMGFSDDDFRKAQEVNSNTQLYKQAGNSIVKQVLMAIFKELIG